MKASSLIHTKVGTFVSQEAQEHNTIVFFIPWIFSFILFVFLPSLT
jgi:hypothetical protein